MASDTGMYSVKPPLYHSQINELPTCMYAMPKLLQPPFCTPESSTDIFRHLETRQLKVLQRLEELQKEIQDIKESCGQQHSDIQFSSEAISVGTSSSQQLNVKGVKDVVVHASPRRPPLSLWVLSHLLQKHFKVMVAVHIHSSLSGISNQIKQLQGTDTQGARSEYQLIITVVWRDDIEDPEIMVNPLLQIAIRGEANIARYLARHILPCYEDSSPLTATKIDEWLDLAHSSIIHGSSEEQQAALNTLSLHLEHYKSLTNEPLTVADIMVWSALIQRGISNHIPPNVARWMKELNSNKLFSISHCFLK